MTETEAEIVWTHTLRMRVRPDRLPSLDHARWVQQTPPAEVLDHALRGLRQVVGQWQAQAELLVRRQTWAEPDSAVWRLYQEQVAIRLGQIAARQALIAEVERDGMPSWPWGGR